MALTSQEIVLTSSPDGPITAYDSISGCIISEFTGSRSPRNGLTLVGKKLVAVSHISPETGTGSVNLYKWMCKFAFERLPVPEPVAPLAATSDGSYLFAGGISGQIHVLSLPSGDVIQSFPAHKKPVSCFKISNDESILLSGSDDGTIAVIPIFKLVDRSPKIGNRDSILCRFVGHQSSVTDIICGVGGANSCTIMSSSLDCTCKMWSLMYETHIRSITFPCPILGVVMDSTEWNFYAAGADGMVYRGALKVLSRQALKEGRKIVPLSHKHNATIVSIGMMNGGLNLVTASDDGNAWIWDIESGQMLKFLGLEVTGMSCLVVNKVYGDVGKATGRLEAEFSGGFSRKELQKPIGEEVLELEERLNIVAKDRKRSISNFEAAIETYTKLLKLIAQEPTQGNTSGGVGDEDKK